MADFGTCAIDWPLLDQWEDELATREAGLVGPFGNRGAPDHLANPLVGSIAAPTKSQLAPDYRARLR